MTERPVLFSGPMVRAILAGTKTQTRRAVKGEALRWLTESGFSPDFVAHPENTLCPYGRPGDRLWVRETWAVPHRYDHLGPSNIPTIGVPTHYAATEERGGLLWRPSIHMCRWASRITLEVTGVRVERLQDISAADALAEGVDMDQAITMPFSPSVPWATATMRPRSARQAFLYLWESINGRGSWDANPWVWVISFERAA